MESIAAKILSDEVLLDGNLFWIIRVSGGDRGGGCLVGCLWICLDSLPGAIFPTQNERQSRADQARAGIGGTMERGLREVH